MSTVTMQELEYETAELLPPRETLWVASGPHQSNYSANGNDDGNQNAQGGLIALNVGLFNGSFDGNGNSTGQSNSNY
jgi:hypothetical protein